MENIIKTRLNQNNEIKGDSSTEISSSSSSQHSRDIVHPAVPPPREPTPSRQQQPRRRQPEAGELGHHGVQDHRHTETRSLVYDIVIAIVIVIIALLLYRRISLFSEVTSPTSPPAN